MMDQMSSPNVAGRVPKFRPPRGACDTHLHIYGPFERFPLAPGRHYNVTRDATLEDYRDVMDRLGLERAVVVNGGGNGNNNEVTLDAISRMGGRLKGVALLDPEISDRALRHLHEGGMTGFRMRANGKGALGFADAARMAPRVRDFGWHVEFHVATVDDAVAALPHLQALGLPYVLDHVAHLGPEQSLEAPAVRRILDTHRNDVNCWVNLYSFYQRSASGGPDYADMIPIVEALLKAAPDRLVWGTNWPHIVIEVPMPDDVDLLNFLFDAVPDPASRDLILSHNPGRLYGWDD